jgi:hypothetical protein
MDTGASIIKSSARSPMIGSWLKISIGVLYPSKTKPGFCQHQSKRIQKTAGDMKI